MAIDDLLQTMHDDRLRVVDAKLSAIEREVLIRRLESLGLSAALIKQIDDLTEQIFEAERMADPRRKDNLERERRDRQVQLQSEAVQKWRDIQLLRQETRHDNRERREETQRYDRLEGALYES